MFPEQSDADLKPSTTVSEDSKIEARVGTAYTVKDVEINHQSVALSTAPVSPHSVLKTPVFLAHSQDDDIVPFELGNDLHQIINKLGFDVTWKKYEDKGHQIHPIHGVDDMSLFLQRVMNT
jgi:predicted esterase